MRVPTFLTASRHHVWYFRYPLPAAIHPRRLRTEVKLSLGTADRRLASVLGRSLAACGDAVLAWGKAGGVDYVELREKMRAHFTALLGELKQRLEQRGPLSAEETRTLEQGSLYRRTTIWSNWPLHMEPLDEFSKRTGIPLHQDDKWRWDFGRWYGEYCEAALQYARAFDTYDFGQSRPPLPVLTAPSGPNRVGHIPITTLKEAAERFIEESQLGERWTVKTKAERDDHLALLFEICGANTDVRAFTKAEASRVKDILRKYPKNRHKRKETRGLGLNEAIAASGGITLTATTINKYLQTYSVFFTWVSQNGYGENAFDGLTIRKGKKLAEKVRRPFSSDQMASILSELTRSDSPLINAAKPWHKWGPLLAAYSGARLNEIAQLHVADVRKEQGIDVLDLNEDAADKSLKASASRRLIPVHSKLIELGFLTYVEKVRSNGHKRLFPDLTYDKQNGWGRNLGRWFNDTFLVKLNIKSDELVFHSFRHTVVNRLSREGVPEPIVKAVIGHAQQGVTQAVYNREGFSLEQLKDAVERLDYSFSS